MKDSVKGVLMTHVVEVNDPTGETMSMPLVDMLCKGTGMPLIGVEEIELITSKIVSAIEESKWQK